MPDPNVRVVGRYALYGAIASGGMATVHLGRLLGPVGFSRTVAIKRLHAQFASDPEFVSMFLDEARLAARIRHPNVVPTLDVVATGGELFLVMEYVAGESLSRLSRVLRDRQEKVPLRVLSNTMTGVLHGLHAAHEAKDERGLPLGIVHRDVSPQNVLVGTDGVPRVLDFGVAKAAGRMQTTKEGQIKGKLAYMPPEQLRGAAVTRQTDIYAAGVMLWELVTGQRLFGGDNEGAIVAKILDGRVEPPSQVIKRARPSESNLRAIARANQDVRTIEALDATILRALAMEPEMRFATAREMALEIERHCPPATASECGDWVESIARDVLNSRAALVSEIESSASLIVEGAVNAVLTTRNSDEIPALSVTGPQMPLSPIHPPSAYIDGPPVTQPSSISVSTVGMPAPTNRRMAVAAIVGILVGLSSVAIALAYRISQTSASHTLDMPTAPIESAPFPADPLVPSPSGAVTTISAEDVEVHDAGHAHPTNKGTTKRGPRPDSRQDSHTHADDCTPSFWFDDAGVKRYKPQCFGKN